MLDRTALRWVDEQKHPALHCLRCSLLIPKWASGRGLPAHITANFDNFGTLAVQTSHDTAIKQSPTKKAKKN